MFRNILIILILFTVAAMCISGESLFLYVEENTNGEPGPFPPPVKEGIFNGLFERDFIVFDSGDKQTFDVDWKGRHFLPLLDIAKRGGADFVVALLVEASEKREAGKKTSVTVKASYYLVSAENGKIIDRGDITDNNTNEDDDRNHEAVGFDVGMKISEFIGRSIDKYLDQL